MSWHKIKRRRADIEFSDYIRELRGWRCEKCKKVCKVNGVLLHRLEASHYYSRRNESVRFDENNVRVLCSGCHQRMGEHTRDENGEYDLWMKELLGEDEYKRLKIRANASGKRDDKLNLIIIRAKMKELKEKEF